MVWNTSLQDAGLLKSINCICASLSLIGSVVMFYFCWNIQAKSVYLKLILATAFSNFFFALSNLMSTFEGNTMTVFCGIEAFLRSSSYILTIYFTAAIALLCYKASIIYKKLDQDRFFKRLCFIGFGVCVVLGTLPEIISDIQYTNGDLLCSITYSENASLALKLIIRVIYTGIPFLGGVLVTLIACIGTVKRVKTLLPSGFFKSANRNAYRLFWYPAVLFISLLPGIVDDFYSTVTNMNQPVALIALHLSMTHLIGFSNALVYGLHMRTYYTQANSPDSEKKLLKADSMNESSVSRDLLIAAGEF